MRSCLSSLAAALLLCTQAGTALAGSACLSSSEQSAFQVMALKNDLMVAALECGRHARYNAIVDSNRAEFLADEDLLSQWFVHSYGSRGQSMHDDYVTQMANVRSRASFRAGDGYCDIQDGLFAELDKSSKGLSPIAARLDIPQPVRLSVCVGGPMPYDPPAAPVRGHRASTVHARHHVAISHRESRPQGYDPTDRIPPGMVAVFPSR